MQSINNSQTHELIPIVHMEISDQKTQTVNLRHLHARLKSGWQFSQWIKNRIEAYGFVENQDFVSLVETLYRETGATVRTEFYGTLGMAKELAMVERTEMGRKIRKYFIACEKRLQETQKTKAIEDRRTAAVGALHLSRDLQKDGLDICDVARLCMFRQSGMTQKESAGALGVSREKVQKIENQLKDFGIKFAYIPGNKRARMAFDSFNSLF